MLVTGGAQPLSVFACSVDSIGTVDVLVRQNSVINSPTTTVVVSPPASGHNLNVKTLAITNEGGSSESVTVQHTDGTTVVNILGPVTLPAGYTLYWSAYGPWNLVDTSGVRYGLR